MLESFSTCARTELPYGAENCTAILEEKPCPPRAPAPLSSLRCVTATPHAAIAWLTSVLGFTAQAVYDGPDKHRRARPAHVRAPRKSRHVDCWVRLRTPAGPPPAWCSPTKSAAKSPARFIWSSTTSTAVYAAARAAGANVTAEMSVMEYGGKGFGCTDPEGYLWSIGEYDPWA